MASAVSVFPVPRYVIKKNKNKNKNKQKKKERKEYNKHKVIYQEAHATRKYNQLLYP
jgi:hypothetical protein